MCVIPFSSMQFSSNQIICEPMSAMRFVVRDNSNECGYSVLVGLLLERANQTVHWWINIYVFKWVCVRAFMKNMECWPIRFHTKINFFFDVGLALHRIISTFRFFSNPDVQRKNSLGNFHSELFFPFFIRLCLYMHFFDCICIRPEIQLIYF